MSKKRWQNGAALLTLIVGAIWTLQGADVLGGSFMSGRLQWLYIGIAMVIGGIGALWWINAGKARGP